MSKMVYLTRGGGVLWCICVDNVVLGSQSSDRTGQDIQTILLINRGWVGEINNL